MTRKNLTDKAIKAMAAAPKGTTIDVWDAVVPGLGVRISEKGRKTFILMARYGGSKNPTRRAMGVYNAMTLEKARQTARDWLADIGKGIDPAIAAKAAAAEEIKRQDTTFAGVVDDFIKEKLASERKGKEVERDIRRDLLPRWRDRPITSITDLDVVAVVKAKRRTAPAQARNLLGIVKRFFGWVIDQRIYGVRVNPTDGLKPRRIIGEKTARERVLSEDELKALWRAASRTSYPVGPTYKLLMMTALRLNEVADASWKEINAADSLWVIPAIRMKGKNGKARAHAVPLTDSMIDLLEGLPRFTGGHFIFSTTGGESPAWMTDKIKKRIDARMLRTLKALARCRGDDPASVDLQHWTNHDIRRSVRSQLSRLKVTEEAREAVLAHVRPGIKGVYDHHDYLDEKREALTLWESRLREIAGIAPSSKEP